MAACLASTSLFGDDDVEEHMNDPRLLQLLDQSATMREAKEAHADTPQRSPPPETQHSARSPPPSNNVQSDSTLTTALPSDSSDHPPILTSTLPTNTPASPSAAIAAESTDLTPSSYSTLPFPLPAYVPTPCTAWSLLHIPPTVLSLGCPHLDELLGGGLRPGITELVGEAGSAKSQICFQLLLQVQLGLPPLSPAPRFPLSHYGLDGCGYYIVTEGRPPMTRLQQLQEAMHRRFDYTASHDFLANVFMQEAHSVDQLLSIVEQLAVEHSRVREQRLRLLIIDSVAGLFRVDDGVAHANSAARADAQFRLSSALRRLSGQQQLVVVLCNQVTDRFLPAEPILRSSETYRDRYTIHTSGRQVMPSLGLSWANCIDVRVAVSRRGGARGGGSGSGSISMVVDGSEVVREMEVMFAPHLPRRLMSFVVDAEGVRGRENSLKLRDGVDGVDKNGEEWMRSPTKLLQQQKQQQSSTAPVERVPLAPISVNVPVAARAPPTAKNVR